MKEGLILESIKPEKLTNNELLQIAEVEKDMWAYGIGEYVKCNNCGLIHSKNDIFGHLSNDIKKESVTRLEEIISGDFIPCNRCEGDTDFIYDIETNIIDIKKRLLDTKASFMSILRSDINGNIEGFMDGYIDELINIYNKELKIHYGNIGYEKICEYIFKKNKGNIPELFLSFSSMGTIEKKKSFYNVFHLIKSFFGGIGNEYGNILGITELDTGSNLHGFHHSMGILKLGITDNEKLKEKLINKKAEYNSDLYIQPNVIKKYKEEYNLSIKEFIRKNKKIMKEVIVA